jgi:hypothetical protein
VTVTAFLVALLLGSALSALALLARYRLLEVEKPTLPAEPAEKLVLQGSAYPRWLRLMSFAGLFCLLGSLSLALAPGQASRAAPLLALAAVALVFALHLFLDARTAPRLELDDTGFKLGQRRSSRKVQWIHLTELRGDRDVIRFRVNRALVRGSSWRYWDGAIRNRWGVDTRQLLRLLERYRERALETAPHYISGRAER